MKKVYVSLRIFEVACWIMPIGTLVIGIAYREFLPVVSVVFVSLFFALIIMVL